ncbi:MAG TPA: RelA/SpoT domain-containing protein [Sedimentisphaerales bacterium]|nr:RelA/SpoT domain-containing protein [Sedimentisphaerales bacterium]
MTTDKSDEFELQIDYENRQASAERLRSALVEQIKELMAKNLITLAVPIESRVKSWSSISGKIERINLKLKDILELNDLVGIRLIFLFKRDLEKCRELIEENLEIIEQEDTASRLGESQFGYQSYHYVIMLPEKWLSTPTLSDFAEYKAEIQVKTIAQHIWAAASHNLQYKQEDNVPKTVRRSIYRVSAFLETVDLEFERVLSERDAYVEETKPDVQDEPLNVDLLRKIMTDYVPITRPDFTEEYSDLLEELSNCKIKKTSELLNFINENLEAVKEELPKESDYYKDGIFSHTALIRMMIMRKFNIVKFEQD